MCEGMTEKRRERGERKRVCERETGVRGRERGCVRGRREQGRIKEGVWRRERGGREGTKGGQNRWDRQDERRKISERRD